MAKGQTVHDVYSMMYLGFANPAVSIFYMIAVALLSVHLLHGVDSMFQTFGVRNHRWSTCLRRVVVIYCLAYLVGNVAIPTALVERMRASPCLDLTLPMAERVALLMEDYAFFVHDHSHFCNRLDVLTVQRGKAVIEAWKAQVRNNAIEPVVQELLQVHYDPVYLQSMQRNFVQYPQALAISASDRSQGAMEQLAQTLMAAN